MLSLVLRLLYIGSLAAPPLSNPDGILLLLNTVLLGLLERHEELEVGRLGSS